MLVSGNPLLVKLNDTKQLEALLNEGWSLWLSRSYAVEGDSCGTLGCAWCPLPEK